MKFDVHVGGSVVCLLVAIDLFWFVCPFSAEEIRTAHLVLEGVFPFQFKTHQIREVPNLFGRNPFFILFCLFLFGQGSLQCNVAL